MKKLVSMMLILCMACLMLPAMADEEITGDWYLKIMKMGEQEYDAAAMGYAVTMTLNEDGSVVMTVPGDDPASGTWTIEGDEITVIANDSPAKGMVSEGVFMLASEDGQVMIFTREAPETVALAEVIPAESAEEFYGPWTIVYLDMEGRIMDIAAMGDEGALVTISEETMEIAGEGTISGMLSLIKMDAPAFADGMLTIQAAPDALNPNLSATAELLEDGMVKLTITSTSPMSLYLAPVEDAEEAPAA